MKFKVAVIGGGASGLFAANIIAESGIFVDLFEKNSDVGKKILATGNGHCNIFNKSISTEHYAGRNVSEFAKTIFHIFNFEKFSKLCSKMGLLLDIKDDGRVYPLSYESRAVVFLLQNAASSKKCVNITTNTLIDKIEKTKNGFVLFDDKNKKIGFYDKVLIAAGTSAAFHINGQSNGFKLAESLGHRINTPYPSLVPLECYDVRICRRMEGVKIFSCVDLYVDRSKKESVCGDVLFTKYGLSGFAVLDISQKASFYLSKNRSIELAVNLLPKMDRQDFFDHIYHFRQEYKNTDILTALLGVLPKKISKTLLYTLKIDSDLPVLDISKKTLKSLADLIFGWKFEITSTHGFKYAEVSGGGVDVGDIDAKTMESKIIEGLYFSGEILDIVGKRGGYNLAFAFASGYLAAKGITGQRESAAL